MTAIAQIGDGVDIDGEFAGHSDSLAAEITDFYQAIVLIVFRIVDAEIALTRISVKAIRSGIY